MVSDVSARTDSLNADFAFDGIVEGFASGGADEHLGTGDDVAVFVVPVVTGLGSDLDDSDAGIILALGKPGFEDGFPKLLILDLSREVTALPLR